MSITVDYFVKTNENLANFAFQINDCLGCSLQPCQENPEVYSAWLLGMELTLSQANEYENDQELDFENFTVEIGFKTWASGAVIRPIQLPSILTVVYALHCSLGITGMLVYDMQRLLARYVERDMEDYRRRLYDLVSNMAFINYSAHLAAVSRRLPESLQGF